MIQEIKKPLKVLGISLAILLIVWIAAGIVKLRAHVQEDMVISGSLRVIYAMSFYYEKHGRPPERLDKLVPEFMESIPTIPGVSKIEYRLSPDGTNWTLDLHWTAHNPPLIFRRTTVELSPADAKRWIETKNGCYVLTYETAQPFAPR